MIAILPLGIDLTTSVMGAVDENDAFKFTMETCTRAGCFAKVVLEDSLLGQMKNGKLLTATFTARGVEEPVQLVGSLNGMTAGIGALGFQ